MTSSSSQRSADLVGVRERLSEVAPSFLSSRAAERYFCHHFATPEVPESWRMCSDSVLLLSGDKAPAAFVDDEVSRTRRSR